MAHEDPEIEAMATIAGALEDLHSDTQARVLEWAARRFNVQLGDVPRPVGSGQGRHQGGSEDHSDDGGQIANFQDFVDLFDAAGPRTEAERALVGGYWFQVVGGNADFQAQAVNTALKDVGVGIGNITEAFKTLQERKPALVRQVAKSGRTKQARKKYKLTTAGTSVVRQMLAQPSGDGEES